MRGRLGIQLKRHDCSTVSPYKSLAMNVCYKCNQDILKGNAILIQCGSQIVYLIYQITNFTISTSYFVHYSKNRVIFNRFYLLIQVLKMDWILFIAIAYSMVGVSLAGFVSANKCRRYSHLHKFEFYCQTSSLLYLNCHFHGIYVTITHKCSF